MHVHIIIVYKLFKRCTNNIFACLCRKDRLEAEAKSGSEKFDEVYSCNRLLLCTDSF